MSRERLFGSTVSGHPALFAVIYIACAVATVIACVTSIQQRYWMGLAVQSMLGAIFLFAACRYAGQAWRLWQRRQRQAIASGLCRKCGYDVRATPRRCPECGRRSSAAADCFKEEAAPSAEIPLRSE